MVVRLTNSPLANWNLVRYLGGSLTRLQPSTTRRAAEVAPAVDDAAEELGGDFGVVDGGVRLLAIEVDAGALAGGGEHGVAVGEGAERDGVEHGKFVEVVGFDAVARARGLYEREVEKGVVADHDGFIATAVFELGFNGFEEVE